MVMLGSTGQALPAAIMSGHEEQSYVASFFGGQSGYFVEVGAYDPVYQSQSYHLELAGWKGLLIEPLPDLADNLRRNRRASVRQCACVAPQQVGTGTIPLLERRGNSTVRFDPSDAGSVSIVEVPAATLDAVLAEEGVTRIDFLSIDVEGAEPDVLRGLDLRRYNPRLVLVDDMDRFGETRRLLRRAGYRLVRRTGHNAWFVPRGEVFATGMKGRMQLAWTYSVGRAIRRLTR